MIHIYIQNGGTMLPLELTLRSIARNTAVPYTLHVQLTKLQRTLSEVRSLISLFDGDLCESFTIWGSDERWTHPAQSLRGLLDAFPPSPDSRVIILIPGTECLPNWDRFEHSAEVLFVDASQEALDGEEAFKVHQRLECPLISFPSRLLSQLQFDFLGNCQAGVDEPAMRRIIHLLKREGISYHSLSVEDLQGVVEFAGSTVGTITASEEDGCGVIEAFVYPVGGGLPTAAEVSGSYSGSWGTLSTNLPGSQRVVHHISAETKRQRFEKYENVRSRLKSYI